MKEKIKALSSFSKIRPSKNFSYFIIALLLTLLVSVGINYFQGELEDFFVWQQTKNLPQTAQLEKDFFERFRPFRNWKIKSPEIAAKAAISVFFEKGGKEKVLFEKNAHQKLPFASLTKLMTALVVLENYPLSKTITITEKLPESNGQLQRGEKFAVKDLLYFLLVASDNDAAFNLAKEIGLPSFVFLMNKKARQLHMKNTFFSNPTGLDPDNDKEGENLSTAEDLALLGKAVFEKPLLAKILSTPEIEIYSQENLTPHHLENTNKLLEEKPEILGGKTGWTPRAGGCLLIVSEAPKNKGKIVSVILGSEARFKELEKLITWIEKAYLF